MANKFEYKYTAPTAQERAEVESIRAEYTENIADSKVAQLRKLDEKVKKPPMVWGLSMGIIGTLIFGGGLSLILEFSQIVWGSVLSIAGLVPIVLAYPVYQRKLEKNKKKYSVEILRLTDEILGENKEEK